MAKQAPRPAAEKTLSAKHSRFVAEYLLDLNATQAAIRAGYSPKTAKVQGSRLLTNAAVGQAIGEALARRAARVEVKADDVLRELARIGLSDIRQAFDPSGRLRSIHELPDDIARAVASVDNEELWGDDGDGGRAPTGTVRKLKLWSKPEALTTLAKHLGLLVERREVTGPDGGPLVVEVRKLAPEGGE